MIRCALIVALALSACTTEPVWVTPDGVSLGVVDCDSPAPLVGGKRAEVCLARAIAQTPDEIVRCEQEGGRVGPISPIDDRFACTYRKPGAAG
jgi:ABC-type ATPase involved in cell division